jgi:hypothetical protein
MNREAMAFDSQVRKRLGLEASGTQGPPQHIFTVKARAVEPWQWRRQFLRNSLDEGRSQCHRSAIWRSCLARVPGAYAPGYRMPRLRRSGVTEEVTASPDTRSGRELTCRTTFQVVKRKVYRRHLRVRPTPGNQGSHCFARHKVGSGADVSHRAASLHVARLSKS